MQIQNRTITGKIRSRGIALYFYLVPIWLFILSLTTYAQTASVRPVSPGAINQSARVMMSGTIRQLVMAQAAGTPAGAQLVVEGPQGTFTAGLGANLSRDLQKILTSGKSVQVSGTMQAVDGQQYMNAYVLTVDGNQITIRNKNGFLAHTSSRTRTDSTSGALYGGTK
jgi:hypothetical protein